MTRFELKSMQPPAAPQWQGKPTRGDISVLITVLPVGWRGDWHENPKPQWIVPLSGRWWVEAMDGEPPRIRPRRIFLRRRPELPRARRPQRPHVRHARRRAGGADGDPVQRPRRRACASRAEPCRANCSSTMTRSKSSTRASPALTLDNAPLEKLAEGFRWLEGLVWMGDWDACCSRTCRTTAR